MVPPSGGCPAGVPRVEYRGRSPLSRPRMPALFMGQLTRISVAESDCELDRSRELITESHSPAPVISIGLVGVADPPSFSTVMANALASVPGGRGGLTTLPLP
jgi:hypothetical protein